MCRMLLLLALFGITVTGAMYMSVVMFVGIVGLFGYALYDAVMYPDGDDTRYV